MVPMVQIALECHLKEKGKAGVGAKGLYKFSDSFCSSIVSKAHLKFSSSILPSLFSIHKAAQ